MRKLNKKISSLFVSGIELLLDALEYDLGRHGRVSSPK